jgi:hypothetical protein
MLQKENPSVIRNIEFDLGNGPVLIFPHFGLLGNEVKHQDWRDMFFVSVEVYSLVEPNVVVLL